MPETGLQAPEAQRLLWSLEKLRAYEGLTEARMLAGRSDVVAPLLELSAVRRLVQTQRIEAAEATLRVVADCVLRGLSPIDGMVTDAVLGLGVHASAYRDAGVDVRVIERLRGPSLGQRRSAVREHWPRLLTVLDGEPTAAPQDRMLRARIEPRALRELAARLIRWDPPIVRTPGPSDVGTARRPGRPHRRVLVLGGAVMDMTFRVPELPHIARSVEALEFSMSPGGKGLTQAVAASRLGMDVELVAAVGDDRHGRDILEFLWREGVDTSLVKVVPGVSTAVTGVVERELGDSIAVNWRNDYQVRLDAGDVLPLVAQMRARDAVFATFELPRPTLQGLLEELATLEPSDRPLVIVTPGQPYRDGPLRRNTLRNIDFLVAHAWELDSYTPTRPRADGSPFDELPPDAVAHDLIRQGVAAVFLVSEGGCQVFVDDQPPWSIPPPVSSSSRETSVARDAFCAALAFGLLEQGPELTEEIVRWATAAMAAAAEEYPRSNPMPTLHQVESLLKGPRERARWRLPTPPPNPSR